jgi:hypothetical protein
MSGQTQTLLAGREDGVPGNCVQAAVASLLDLPIEGVPHFVLFRDWRAVMHDWLADNGYSIDIFAVATIPDERCIVVGPSPRDVTHVCVAEQGAVGSAWFAVERCAARCPRYVSSPSNCIGPHAARCLPRVWTVPSEQRSVGPSR